MARARAWSPHPRLHSLLPCYGVCCCPLQYELFSDTFVNSTVSFSEPELEWDAKSIIETTLLLGIAAGMYTYSRKAWSPQTTATGSVDFSKVEKVDNSWDAIELRGPAKRLHK